jgi:hypothetical protein
MVAVVARALVLGGVAFIRTQNPVTDADTIVSTSTTLPPTAGPPPNPQVVAQGELRALIEDDPARLQSLVGNLLPRVSTKWQGEVWNDPYLGIDETFPYQLADTVLAPPVDAPLPTAPTTPASPATERPPETPTTTTTPPVNEPSATCVTELTIRERAALLVWPAVYSENWPNAVAAHQSTPAN